MPNGSGTGAGLRGAPDERAVTPHGLHLPQSRYVLPSFVERTNYGIKESNPYNKLFEERIIFLGAPIDDVVANDVIAQLIVLESTDPDRDILIYINSPGGSFTALTAIYDTMQFVRPEIQTLLHGPGRLGRRGAAGRRHQGQAVRPAELPDPDPPAVRRGPGPGHRPGDPGQRDHAHARAAGGDPGPAHRPDRSRQVRADIERDTILTAAQAKEYGIVDEVITTRKTGRRA